MVSAMAADLEQRKIVRTGTTAEAGAHPPRPVPSRVVVDPPPIAPSFARGWRRDLRLAIGIGALALAGITHLIGVPSFIGLSLAAFGLVALLVFALTLRDENRFASQLRAHAEHSREELEHLADRMWELQESEERFRGLTDALGDIVVHRDREGRIVYANRVLADLVGLEPDRLGGRTLIELGIDIGIVPDAAFAEGECLSSTDVAIHAREGARWFSWIELSVRDPASDAVSHRAIARDITDRKRAETALIKARESAEFASQAKSRFLATVSHEIRTPMNGIVGMSRLLAGTRLSPEQNTYVSAISTSASALLALIEDLLDYSKIEAGRLALEPQPVSLRELSENVVELLASRAYAKKIGLGCHVARNVPGLVSADPGRLRQVLLNLVGNAIKFTDLGGVLVTVEMAGTASAPAIRIAVADTGPGLSEADRERIFKEFEQADSTSTRKHGGAGLGLAISKRIVDAMGGRLSGEARRGGGSVFALEFPATVEAADLSPFGPADDLAGATVLVMSKNAMEAEAIARTVREHGGHCVVAATLEKALAQSARRCDAMLVDARLETLDGSLLRRLRTQGFAARAITLIAPNDRVRLAESRANGYASFLARPVRGQTLLRMLRSDRPAEPAPARAGKARSRPGSRRRGLNVLIAEDNEINAMLACAALSKAGHRVETVTDGKAAVDLLTAGAGHRFDVVLMDLHMPQMDGLDAVARVRRHEGARAVPPVPILVLSADGQERTRHVAIANGASGFVTKPVDPADLVSAVEAQATA